MDEIRKSEIIYEEGWRDRLPDKDDELPEEPLGEEQLPEPERGSGAFLLTVQLVVCIIVAIALLLLKSMDSGIYKGFSEWFLDELKKPVISQGVFSAIDDSLFKNQAQASPDEAEAG